MTILFPDGFLWGTATAAHQVEGGNWNNDWWAWEHNPASGCTEPSGDACDQFNRYPEDIALLSELGFGAYRFSIEWSRIEPEEGEFSRASIEHYRRMCAECLEHGVMPVVTFHHFTTPRWVAAAGGWEDPATAERFARFCEHAVEGLGDLVGIACTLNEPNVVTIMGYLFGFFPPGLQDFDARTRAHDTMVAAHRRAVDALKAGPGTFPVGVTVAMSDWGGPEGSEEHVRNARAMHEDAWLEAARGDDFVGVQAYSRTYIGADGLPATPPPGAEILDMSYEYWPQALEVSIRHAIDVSGCPVYVTENGIGTRDDEKRIRYVRDALGGLGRCLDDGLDVRGYFYWSLLDNFEWALGYMPRFGLVGVDRATQRRTLKPSAGRLGDIARSNRLE